MQDSSLPSRRALEDTVPRAVQFLRAVGTHRVIHASLASSGFTEKEHALGWKLVHECCGYVNTQVTLVVDEQVHAAITEIDRTDEPLCARVGAALRRLHPEQYEFVFAGNLGPTTGAGAVVVVNTLLDRLDALDNSPERKATRKQDHAALNTLTERGITPDERTRLRQLTKAAQQPAGDMFPSDPYDDDHLKHLTQLYRWHQDWSETARALIKRRDYLILLGLAKRKKPGKKANEGNAPETPA